MELTDGRKCVIECHSGRVNFQEQVRCNGVVVNRAEVLSLAVRDVVLLKGVERKAVFAGVCGGQGQSKHCAQASKRNDDSWEHRKQFETATHSFCFKYRQAAAPISE